MYRAHYTGTCAGCQRTYTLQADSETPPTSTQTPRTIWCPEGVFEHHGHEHGAMLEVEFRMTAVHEVERRDSHDGHTAHDGHRIV
jgi:hypothetical protein